MKTVGDPNQAMAGMGGTTVIQAEAGPVAPNARDGMRPAWFAWYALGVLVLATILAYVDRQIIMLVAQPLRETLNLSDTRLGLLQGLALALCIGIAAVPLGWLADRMSRTVLLAICVILWSVSSVGRGMANTFEQMFLATMLLGITEAGLVPIVYGLIPELFRGGRRLVANTVYAATSNVGSATSFIFSGLIIGMIHTIRPGLPPDLQAMDTWRLAFLAVAIPGPLMALLILTLGIRRSPHVSRPQGAGGESASVAEAPGFRQHLRVHWRALTGFFVGLGLLSLGVEASINWTPVVASREFGIDPAEVGVRLGASALTGISLGFVIAQVAIRRYATRIGAALPLRVCLVGGIAACGAAVLFLLVESPNALYAIVCVQLAALMAGTLMAPTAVQDLAPPSLRSRVAGLAITSSVLFKALSPLLVGPLSDALGDSAGSLRVAVAAVAVAGFATGAWVMRASEGTFRRSTTMIAESSGATA